MSDIKNLKAIGQRRWLMVGIVLLRLPRTPPLPFKLENGMVNPLTSTTRSCWQSLLMMMNWRTKTKNSKDSSCAIYHLLPLMKVGAKMGCLQARIKIHALACQPWIVVVESSCLCLIGVRFNDKEQKKFRALLWTRL